MHISGIFTEESLYVIHLKRSSPVDLLITLMQFAPQDEWTSLCDTLASRLLAAGESLPATLCYICAGNIDKTIEIWSRSLAGKADGKSYVDLLQVLH